VQTRNDDLWVCIERLHGQTLRTVTGKPFVVSEVARHRPLAVVVRPVRAVQSRKLAGAAIERAHALGLPAAALTPLRLQHALPGTRNASYIVALLQAIAE
jgi:hypothetical protein